MKRLLASAANPKQDVVPTQPAMLRPHGLQDGVGSMREMLGTFMQQLSPKADDGAPASGGEQRESKPRIVQLTRGKSMETFAMLAGGLLLLDGAALVESRLLLTDSLLFFFELLQLHAGPGAFPLAGVLAVGVYLVCAPTAAFPYTWGDSAAATHAVQAVHVYFCGALLAAYLHSRADAGYPPFRCAATLAALLDTAARRARTR